MVADPDEDALSWSGETDPVATPASAARKPVSDKTGATAGANPVLLITFGIIAGVYLLYAVGWGIHAFTHSIPVAGIFPVIMYQLGEFFSIASPFLWAGAVWLLVRRPMWRLLWLLVGVLVLAPLPFILGG